MEETIGSIFLQGFNYSTVGALQCDGATLQISQYSALYSLIGTTFGGNGTTTFNLPNLSNAAPPGVMYCICYAGYYPSRQ